MENFKTMWAAKSIKFYFWLHSLFKQHFVSKVESYRIIDARFVYEFEGGHIRGAVNFGSWNEEVKVFQVADASSWIFIFIGNEFKNTSVFFLKSLLNPFFTNKCENTFCLQLWFVYFSLKVITIFFQDFLTEFFPPTLIPKSSQESVSESDNSPKRQILIVHCEFSSVRGPKLIRFLRER